MAYSEEKDLIQNMKDLEGRINSAIAEVDSIRPDIEQIRSIKSDLENLSDVTIAVVNQYESTLRDKDDEYRDLLIRCKSQFRQVTDDVESLVNLEVNFTDIKDKILLCLELSEHISNLVKGPFVLMKPENYIPVDDRIPYKHYLKVIDAFSIGDSWGIPASGRYLVSPTLGISYDAK